MSPLLLALALAAAPPAPAPVATGAAPALAAAPRAPEILEGFDPPSGKTFTGNFEDAPADEALRRVLEAAGLSVVLPHGLKSPVSAHFKDAAVEDALRALCAEAGVAALRHGTVVTITRGGPTQPRAPQESLAPAAPDEPEEVAEARRQVAEAQRAVVEAQREAEQSRREAEQEAAEAAREAAEDADPGAAGEDRVSPGDVTLAPGEHVRDLLTMRGNAKLGPGSRARDVTALLGNVEVGPGAIVEHDVLAIRGNVHLLPGARARDATSVGGRVIIDPGAVVHGQTAKLELPDLPALPMLPPLPPLPPLAGPSAPPAVPHVAHHGSPLIALGKLALEFALYFALGLIVLAAWPRRLERVVQALRLTPARSTAVGLLSVLAIPLLALLLAVTIIGLLLWPVEAVVVVAGSVLGYTALAVLIGRRVPVKHRLTPVGQLAVGTAAITLLTHIPGVGFVLGVLALIVVLGAVFSTRFGQSDPTDAATFPIAAGGADPLGDAAR